MGGPRYVKGWQTSISLTVRSLPPASVPPVSVGASLAPVLWHHQAPCWDFLAMLDATLTRWFEEPSDVISIRDRVQIALATAEEDILKSLLLNCTPPLTQPHRLGSVSAKVGVPMESHRTADGVISFEAVNCVLARSPDEIEEYVAATAEPHLRQREYLMLTRYESETYTLGQNVSLAQAIALLAQSGFSPQQIDDITHLPTEAWHRSWWYVVDALGNFSVPFLRTMRTLHYPDGTLTLQYKDFYSQDKPPCFARHEQRVLVEVRSEQRSFRKTLERINLFREHLGTTHAILICDELSDLETRGFMSQGISIYSTKEITVHTRANCAHCANSGCALNGNTDTGVLMCDRFCLNELG
ncbi:hypothetical protein ACQ4M4_23350 [Leptolyngbya sp. AN02str]|uniref:hypothetical protein n=1 Tax=Leptolyngbya sp. AN02str TaxID=3423363 RepID=UPI003D31126A